MPERLGKALYWADIASVESGAMEQVRNLGEMPFIEGMVGVMPDVHWGKGAPIGTVFATKGTVIPSAVGVDIGCGMMAVKTDVRREELPDDLTPLREKIEEFIPLGPGKRNDAIWESAKPRIEELDNMRYGLEQADWSLHGAIEQAGTDWRKQLGTLGGGNHFIEVTVDEDDWVWGFIHSGSRGIGARLADHFTKEARRMCSRWFVDLPDPDLAFLPRDDRLSKHYMAAVRWAQRYAELNREEMMSRVMEALERYCGGFSETDWIRCHHNFAQWEHRRGHDYLITRKGAIGADSGQRGVIPGSMGTASYVVTGLGNEASFCTAPHGAGRRMSRNKARQKFTMDDFDRDMAGIEVKRDKEFLDELPGAYKDIETVIKQCGDLVSVDHILRQVVNVKGP